jgi:hypothetical protein
MASEKGESSLFVRFLQTLAEVPTDGRVALALEAMIGCRNSPPRPASVLPSAGRRSVRARVAERRPRAGRCEEEDAVFLSSFNALVSREEGTP